MQIAETDRLILRQFTLDDLDILAALFATPEVMRFSLGVKTREQVYTLLQKAIQNYAADGWGFGLWAAEQKRTRDVMGYCGLSRFDDVDGQTEIEIGYRYFPAYWGQGIGTEAAAAVRDLAFDRLGLTRLICMIEAENVASVRVAEKIGMTWEKEIVKWGLAVQVYSIRRAQRT